MDQFKQGGYVYIMSNKTRSVLYIGVTSDLHTRVYQHRNNQGLKFTKKYRCRYLIYYEVFDDIEAALTREKQLKKWKRQWKLDLIKKSNPGVRDLSKEADELE